MVQKSQSVLASISSAKAIVKEKIIENTILGVALYPFPKLEKHCWMEGKKIGVGCEVSLLLSVMKRCADFVVNDGALQISDIRFHSTRAPILA